MANTLADFKQVLTEDFVERHILKSVTPIMDAILSLVGTHDADLAAQILNVDCDIPYEMRSTIDWEAQCNQLIEDADDEIVLEKICSNCGIPFEDIVSTRDWEEDTDGTFTLLRLRQEALPAIKKRLLDLINENKVSWKTVFGDFELYDCDEFVADVLEYWEVSGPARRCLIDANEFVVTAGGMEVWCRTTSGQAISMDECVQKAAIQAYNMGVLQPNFDRINLLDVLYAHADAALKNLAQQPSEDIDDLLTSYKLL